MTRGWSLFAAGLLFSRSLSPAQIPDPPAAAPSGVSAGNPASKKLDIVFEEYSRPGSPGCAVAVALEGKTIAARGYGLASLEHRLPITADTVFDVGSAAKQFTAASVVLLAQDGRLTLDDPIRKYVPELAEAASPVTLRQLLHHTSGLRDYTDLLSLAGARTADVTTADEAIAMLARQKGVEFAAGSRYRYCNSGYFLLSLVVQRVSGKSLRDFARERIFSPLKMSSTQFVDDHREIVLDRATGYSRDKGAFRVAASDWEQTGDGGLQTTARDLLRWHGNFDDPVVGGAALISELIRPGRLSNGQAIDYALGLRVDSDGPLKRIQHGGSWAGFKAQFLRYPEKRLSVAVLCNMRNAVPSRLARAAAAIFLPELTFEAKPAEDAGSAATGASVRDFEGTYWNPERFEIRRISVEDGKVLYRTGSRDTGMPLVETAPGRFRARGAPLRIELAKRGSEGEAMARLTEFWETDPPEVWVRVDLAADHGGSRERFAGAFYSEELDATYRIAQEGSRLVLRRRGAAAATLEAVFGQAFEAGDLGMLVFETDSAGKTIGFRIGGAPRLFFTAVAR